MFASEELVILNENSIARIVYDCCKELILDDDIIYLFANSFF